LTSLAGISPSNELLNYRLPQDESIWRNSRPVPIAKACSSVTVSKKILVQNPKNVLSPEKARFHSCKCPREYTTVANQSS
jgi:hypothetical protein